MTAESILDAPHFGMRGPAKAGTPNSGAALSSAPTCIGSKLLRDKDVNDI